MQRAALLTLLDTGAAGTFDALAVAAGIAPEAARRTLYHLRHEGLAASARQRGGRERAVYAKPRQAAVYDTLAHVRAVWR